jgi:NTE family protein
MTTTRSPKKPINLALQGGGAHGAFTWGVLDYLLEHVAFDIEAVSGTSAGAMNAVVLADGYRSGGADGARAHLERFWRRIAQEARFGPVQPSPIDLMFGNFSLDTSPAYLFLDVFSRFFSPYDVNPLNLNPLREVIESMVDFEAVRACKTPLVHVSATNVHTGKPKVFSDGEITADAVMASACLPLLFQAVEIDGIPYWDGGFGGNPVLYPFFKSRSDDIVLVQINPVERKETPRTARQILNRMNEITFNASLLREFRAIEFVGRLIDEGRLDDTRYKKVRLHRIDGGAALQIADVDASSKLNPSWAFLQHLKEIGQQAAKRWHRRHWSAVGKRSTVDLKAEIV